MLSVRQRIYYPPSATVIPQRAVLHTDTHIAVLGNDFVPKYDKLTKDKGLQSEVFKSYLAEAATGLVTNPTSPQYLWRTLPFTAHPDLLPKLGAPNDHELLVLKHDWKEYGTSNDLICMPALARFPTGWLWKVAAPHDDTTAVKAARALAMGSWNVLRGIFDRPIEALPTTVWPDMFGPNARVRRDGDTLVVTQFDFNAVATLRAVRTRTAILTAGTKLTVPMSFLNDCINDIAKLIERAATPLSQLFWPAAEGAENCANSLVAFARRLGIGPADKVRKREFEGNLKLKPRGKTLHRPCAHPGRFTDDMLALQCQSLTLCGQTPDEANRQSPGQVMAASGTVPPCMRSAGQTHWNNARRFEAAAETRKAAISLNISC